MNGHDTTTRTEVLAGITTFLATMYIIVVNPSILSAAGMPFASVLTATVLVCAFSSIMMGVYAKNPIVVAPGMGINAFFAYSVVQGMGVSWQTALGAVFWSGIVFLVLSVFSIRTWILHAIPRQLRYGVAGGIGLFITFIGLKNAGFVVTDPVTVVARGALDSITLTFVFGLALTSVLVARGVKGALIIGIAVTTVAAIPVGRLWGDASAVNNGAATLVTYRGLVAPPDFTVFFKLDLAGSLKLAMWPVVFAFLFTDLFDSLSTFMGVSEAAGLIDKNGEPRNVKQSLIVDACATVMSGLFGTSAGTSYIESAAGIEQGGRRGLTAVVAGVLFLPFMFFSPLLSVVPSVATAPVLVLVGVFMMGPVLKIRWGRLDDAIPAFLALVLIPLTYSITEGIIWGFLSWTVIKLSTGKAREVSPALLVIDALAIVSFFV
ncbi:MAG: NCS2 family permease [Chitinivibrionales bacterium]|nr:NCS2 family permease [Chitinivibrionales bacterium]MBD3394811.1 NCS2 family permease [Chitinivibrionales bacterium]